MLANAWEYLSALIQYVIMLLLSLLMIPIPDSSIELAGGVFVHGTDTSWQTVVAAQAVKSRRETDGRKLVQGFPGAKEMWVSLHNILLCVLLSTLVVRN